MARCDDYTAAGVRRPVTAEAADGRLPRLRWALAGVLGVAMLMLLLHLGFWQLERAEYKEALARAFEANARQAPAPPRAILAGQPPDAWRYRRASTRGVFDPERQYLLDNRTHAGRAGYHVLTVLRTADASVLVNRGWVEANADRSRLPDVSVTGAPSVVHGRLAQPPRAGLLLGESGYAASSWPKVVQTVDLERMRRQLGEPLLPALLLLEPSHEACYACDWEPVERMGAQRHRGYAVQWFSLAAALVVLLAIAAWKGRASRGR